MLTVEKFLDLTTFENLKLVSGEESLGNIIESVNIMDNPDALDWFTAGEMLLTSGYFFKGNSEMQNQIMDRLHSLNCPALCIKPHQYLGTIPENMIELSNKYKLPIIELPYGLSFSTLFLRTMEKISYEFDTFNRKVLDVHKHFFNVALHDGGLEKISDSLSDLLRAHVFLLDSEWQVLGWKMHGTEGRELALTFGNTDKITTLPASLIESVPPNFHNIENPITRSFDVGNEKVKFVILPVYFNQIHYGFIAAIQTSAKWSRMEFDIMKIGAMTFALELIKLHEIQRAQNRVRRDFLDELLTGKITSMESLTNLANIHGVALELAYNAVVFDVSFSSNLSPEELVKQEQFENAKVKNILSTLDTFNHQHQGNLVIYSRHKQIIVLVGRDYEATEDLRKIKELVLSMIETVESNVKNVTLVAGIGKHYEHIIDVHNSYFEAQSTLSIMEDASSEKIVAHYEDFMLKHFLHRNIDPKEMERFVKEVLGNIITYDLEHQSELVETLEIWVNNQLNTAQAARELFVHRNTMLYRINKIKELLQLDLNQLEDVLSIQLALNVRKSLYV